MPCPNGHELEEKQVAGTSWFAASKSCGRCRADLKTGMSRHSCKACKYHLCTDCNAVAVEEWLKTEITVTIYRAAQPGADEDVWQVLVERGATIGDLRGRIAALYGLMPQMQIVRRDVDSAPLVDDAKLACDEGDVLHLQVATPGSSMSPLGITPMAGIADMISGAMTDLNQAVEQMRQDVESTIYKLTFVLAASDARKETRCSLEFAAVARVAEVLETVKLELDVEDDATGIEFAGQELALHTTLMSYGLTDGDILFVLRRDNTTSL